MKSRQAPQETEKENKLLERQKFIQKTLELVPGLVAVYNIKTGEYIYVNDSITKILGYSKKEWLTKGLPFIASLVHPEDVPVIMERNDQALKKANSKNYIDLGNDPIVAFEYRLKHKNGSWRWLKTDGVIFDRDASGKVEYVMNISVDITERKEAEINESITREAAEEALKNSEEQFRATWNAAADAMVLSDENGIILNANPAYFKLYGYPAEEIIGKNFAIIFPMKMRRSAVNTYKKFFHTNDNPLSIDSTIQRKDGKKRIVESRYAFIERKGKRIAMLSIIRDITQRKEHERQKDEFMAIVSHELKTPVTSLKAYAQVLEHKFTKAGDEKSAEHLAKMDAQIDKLTVLISDLLDVTKIEGGKLQFHNEFFNIDELIDETVEEIQRTTEKHTITKEGKAKKVIWGDRERIGQALTNLLTNAIKYSPHSVAIIVKTSASNNDVKISVQDFGVGIAKEKQSRIFERFYRETGREEITFPGLGLGLYITAQIIKRQGGKISVESQKGKGSTFFIVLPILSKKKQQKNTLAVEEMKHD